MEIGSPTIVKIRWLAAAVVALVTLQFIVYAPALNNGFVRYDDDIYVYNNSNIQSLSAETIAWMFARPYYRSYTPLALLSHAIDYRMWKDNPWGHHLTSLLLHCVNCALVFIVASVLLQKVYSSNSPTSRAPVFFGALVTATLYSIHPIQVESVAWVSDRKDLLLTLFWMLCVLAYLRYDAVRRTKKSILWFLVSLGCFICALLSKTIAIVAPLVLISLDLLVLHRGASHVPRRSLLLEKIPFLLLSIAFGLLSLWAAKSSQLNDVVASMSSFQRALMPLYTIALYPIKLLAPIHLTPVYDSVGAGWMMLANLLTVLISFVVARLAQRGRTVWLFGWVWYVLTIAPTITGMSAGIQAWADRYAYLPSIGLFLCLGGGLGLLWEKSTPARTRWFVAAGLGLLVAVLGMSSSRQVRIWKDSESLWRYAIDKEPALPMPYANLGVALSDPDSALEMYRIALAIQPRYTDVLYNTGIAFETKQMPDSAEYYYLHALMNDTAFVNAYVNLGNLYVNAGRYEEGISLYRKAIVCDPTDPDPHYNLGNALYMRGEYGESLESFMKAITYSPRYSNAYYNMGMVFLKLNDEEAAGKSFVRAARLGNVEAQKLLSGQGYTW
jgi:Tfp pilus assembly protein PilF